MLGGMDRRAADYFTAMCSAQSFKAMRSAQFGSEGEKD